MKALFLVAFAIIVGDKIPDENFISFIDACRLPPDKRSLFFCAIHGIRRFCYLIIIIVEIKTSLWIFTKHHALQTKIILIEKASKHGKKKKQTNKTKQNKKKKNKQTNKIKKQTKYGKEKYELWL